MKNIKVFLAVVLLSASTFVSAEVVSRTPIMQQATQCTERTNATGAVVGAGVGYVAGNLLFGKGAGSLIGAATGGLVGSQVQKPKDCVQVEKLVGFKVISKFNGKLIEDFEPAK